MNKNILKKIKKDLIKQYQETVWVYLKKSNVKDSGYDKYLNEGKSITLQSPEPVKAVVRVLSADTLIRRELGTIYLGAIELIIENQNVNLFKICQKVKYNNVEYSPFIKAIGNKCLVYNYYVGYSKIVLTRVGN